MNLRWLATICAVLCCAGAPGQTPDEAVDNVFEKVSMAVESPHVDWCPAYRGGTSRVLVVAPAYGQRETVELMQRFDLDCEALMTWTQQKLAGVGYGPVQYLSPRKVARRFDEALTTSWDVILVGRLSWLQLHLDHRAAILRQVHDMGAGLVLVAPDRCRELEELTGRNPDTTVADALAAAVPWDDLPAFRGREPSEVIQGGTFGAGRWVALRYQVGGTNHSLTPTQPLPCTNPWAYEYYQSLLASAVHWSAGRQPGQTIGPVADGSVTIVSPEAAPNCDLHVWFHQRRENRWHMDPPIALDLAAGESVVSLPEAELSEGRWIVSLVLRQGAETLAWTSFGVDVRLPATVKELKLVKDAVDAGEPIRGHVRLAGAVPVSGTVHLQLTDRHGRLLARKTIRSRPPEVRFELPGVVPLGTALHTVSAALVTQHGRVLSRRRVDCGVRGRKRPAFHLAIWEENETDRISGLWYERFRDLGVDAVFYRSDRKRTRAASWLMARANLFSAPMFACYSPKTEDTDIGPVHHGCLHEAAVVEKAVEDTRSRARNWSRFGVLHYCDGSDKVMRGPCFCTHTLEAFRDELHGRHASLDALNAAWETAFEEWSSVFPDTLSQAHQRGRYRAWLEHVQFMERSYAAYNRRMVEAVHRIDPGAPVGPDGYGRLNSVDGADWEQLLDVFSFYNLYTYQDPPQLELTRSLAARRPHVRLRSIYYGSYNGHFGNTPFLRRLPWYALLHGYNGLFWWSANGKTTYPFSQGRLAGPDFRATRSFLTSLQQIRQIRRGPIQLISRASRSHSGVAVFHDQLVIHAHTAHDHPSALVSALSEWQAVLEDLGLQYEYVTARDVRDGILSEGFRVLVLPRALAMSEETVDAVDAFMKAGGTVVADVVPAGFDRYLTALQEPRIQGVKMLPEGMLQDYRRQRFEHQSNDVRELLSDLLIGAGVRRIARLKADDAQVDVPGVECVAYRDDGVDYLGFVNWGDRVMFTVTCDDSAVRYDLRRRQVAGEGRSWYEVLEPGDCHLYALLSAAPASVAFRAMSGSDHAWLGVIGTVPETRRLPRGFEFTVIDADGRKRPEYSAVEVFPPNASIDYRIPLALNDPEGPWEVQIVDVLTGRKTVVAVTVVTRPEDP